MDPSQFMENLPDGFDERYQKLCVDLEGRTRPLGLYMEQASVSAVPGYEHDDAPPGKLLVMATFTLGDLAFHPRVQDPEQAQFDEQFREMKVDAEDDEIRDARERFERGELGWKPRGDD